MTLYINGEDLRAIRKQVGLSQLELANEVGVSLRTIGNWERSEGPLNQRCISALLEFWPDLEEPEEADPNPTYEQAFMAGYNFARIEAGLPPANAQAALAIDRYYRDDKA